MGRNARECFGFAAATVASQLHNDGRKNAVIAQTLAFAPRTGRTGVCERPWLGNAAAVSGRTFERQEFTK